MSTTTTSRCRIGHWCRVPINQLVLPRLDGNLIVQGDNLHALKSLLPMNANKADCIFIDPPYNTGNEGWCYNDNVNSPMMQAWLQANPVGIEDWLRHDKWCAMMWPRLRLLHELLADTGTTLETLVFDTAYAVRMMSDIVPNAWWARGIVGEVLAAPQAKSMGDNAPGELSGLIVEELRKWLELQRSTRAEALFRAEVADGRIQFRLRPDGRNWHMQKETETFESEGAPRLPGGDGLNLERSLFWPIYQVDFSSHDEHDIAVYLDGDKALTWWHRNVARSHHALQGWRREKIYPDFIFAVQHGETDSKQSVLQLMTEAFAVEKVPRVGEFEFMVEDGTSVACDLVLMTEWKTRLPTFSAEGSLRV